MLFLMRSFALVCFSISLVMPFQLMAGIVDSYSLSGISHNTVFAKSYSFELAVAAGLYFFQHQPSQKDKTEHSVMEIIPALTEIRFCITPAKQDDIEHDQPREECLPLPKSPLLAVFDEEREQETSPVLLFPVNDDFNYFKSIVPSYFTSELTPIHCSPEPCLSWIYKHQTRHFNFSNTFPETLLLMNGNRPRYAYQVSRIIDENGNIIYEYYDHEGHRHCLDEFEFKRRLSMYFQSLLEFLYPEIFGSPLPAGGGWHRRDVERWIVRSPGGKGEHSNARKPSSSPFDRPSGGSSTITGAAYNTYSGGSDKRLQPGSQNGDPLAKRTKEEPKKEESETEFAALLKTIETGHLLNVINILRENGNLLRKQESNSSGNTPLHIIISSGQIYVEEYIKAHYTKHLPELNNLKNKDGKTPEQLRSATSDLGLPVMASESSDNLHEGTTLEDPPDITRSDDNGSCLIHLNCDASIKLDCYSSMICSKIAQELVECYNWAHHMGLSTCLKCPACTASINLGAILQTYLEEGHLGATNESIIKLLFDYPEFEKARTAENAYLTSLDLTSLGKNIKDCSICFEEKICCQFPDFEPKNPNTYDNWYAITYSPSRSNEPTQNHLLLPLLKNSSSCDSFNCWFCLDCIKCHILTSSNTLGSLRNGFIQCPGDNCENIIPDIITAYLAGERKIYTHKNKAFNQIVENRKQFIRCINPRCTVINEIGVPEQSGEFECLKCRDSFCTQCKTYPYHKALTCDQHREKQKIITEDSFMQGIAESDPDNCKSCPQCFFIIIKDKGCDHMSCTNCHEDFSWSKASYYPNLVFNNIASLFNRRCHSESGMQFKPGDPKRVKDALTKLSWRAICKHCEDIFDTESITEECPQCRKGK